MFTLEAIYMSKMTEYLHEPVEESIELLLENNVKLSPLDEKSIESTIKNKRNARINLQSFPENTITVIHEDNQIEFQYNKTLHEVSNFIIDYCDDNEYTSKHFILNNNIQHIIIEKEK